MSRVTGGWRLENDSPEAETKMHSDENRHLELEMAQWLGAQVALMEDKGSIPMEDKGSIPSSHMGSSQRLLTPAPGDPMPL